MSFFSCWTLLLTAFAFLPEVSADYTLEIDWVNQIALSPDGKQVAIASGLQDSQGVTLRLVDSEMGKESKPLDGHKGGVCSVKFATTKPWLVSGGYDATAILWDLALAKPKKVFVGHKEEVLSLALSPQETLLATGSADETVKLWELSSGKCVHTFEASDAVRFLAFSPEGNLIAAGLRDCSICIWDIKSQKQVATLKGHKTSIWALAFTTDGTTLVSCDASDIVDLWSVKDWKKNAELKSPLMDQILSINISKDGQTLVLGGSRRNMKQVSEGIVSIWDLTKMKEKSAFQVQYLPIMSIAQSPDSKHIFTAGFKDIGSASFVKRLSLDEVKKQLQKNQKP